MNLAEKAKRVNEIYYKLNDLDNLMNKVVSASNGVGKPQSGVYPDIRASGSAMKRDSFEIGNLFTKQERDEIAIQLYEKTIIILVKKTTELNNELNTLLK